MTDEIRKVLGRNISVHAGLSVGVAWTSVCISHEPPEPPPKDEDKEAAPAAAKPRLSTPPSSGKINVRAVPETVPETGTSPGAPAPDSPASVGTAAATVVAVRRAFVRKEASGDDNPRPAGKDGQRRPGGSPEKEMKKERTKNQKKEKKKKHKARGHRRGDGGSGSGSGSDGGGNDKCYRANGESGSRGDKAGGKERWKRQRRDQRRPRSTGAHSPRKHVPKRRRRKERGGSVTNDRSSGEKVRRAALEMSVLVKRVARSSCSARLAHSPIEDYGSWGACTEGACFLGRACNCSFVLTTSNTHDSGVTDDPSMIPDFPGPDQFS